MYKVDRILGLDDIDSELLNKAQSIKIAVFGLGGLGCPALLYLVSGGYKNFTLVDFDTIDESNLARQILYKLDDIGKYKAEVADREVKKINPAMHNHVVINRASDEEVARIVNSNDIILDCTDNFDARLNFWRNLCNGRKRVGAYSTEFDSRHEADKKNFETIVKLNKQGTESYFMNCCY